MDTENTDERTELHRKIRWQMTKAEESLTIAISALRQARELAAVDPVMREEFGGDIRLLRGKLDTLAETLA